MAGFIAFVLLLAYGLLRIRFRPQQVACQAAYLRRHPVRSLGRGLAVWVTFGALLAALFGAVLYGSPLTAVAAGLVTLVILPLVLYLVVTTAVPALVPVLIVAGRRIGRGRLNDYAAFLVAAVVLALFMLVPYAGEVIAIGVVALGTGVSDRERFTEPRNGSVS